MRNILYLLCDMTEFNEDNTRGVRLRKYLISNEEWVVLDQLFELLDVRMVVDAGSCLETDASPLTGI